MVPGGLVRIAVSFGFLRHAANGGEADGVDGDIGDLGLIENFAELGAAADIDGLRDDKKNAAV